jgi:helicase
MTGGDPWNSTRVGAGRIIFTASGADEPAYEHGTFGHGFLTYYLLEALRGAEEVVSAGKLSLYKLLDHVTRGSKRRRCRSAA